MMYGKLIGIGRIAALGMALGLIASGGCSEPALAPGSPVAGEGEPDHVEVQDLLVRFGRPDSAGSIHEGDGVAPTNPRERTESEAGKLAEWLFQQAEAGEDFDALVKEYSDGEYPGIKQLANYGATSAFSPQRRSIIEGAVQRQLLEKGIGDAAFQLEVGEVIVVPYDPETCPTGWHVIKRTW